MLSFGIRIHEKKEKEIKTWKSKKASSYNYN